MPATRTTWHVSPPEEALGVRISRDWLRALSRLPDAWLPEHRVHNPLGGIEHNASAEGLRERGRTVPAQTAYHA